MSKSFTETDSVGKSSCNQCSILAPARRPEAGNITVGPAKKKSVMFVAFLFRLIHGDSDKTFSTIRCDGSIGPVNIVLFRIGKYLTHVIRVHRLVALKFSMQIQDFKWTCEMWIHSMHINPAFTHTYIYIYIYIYNRWLRSTSTWSGEPMGCTHPTKWR